MDVVYSDEYIVLTIMMGVFHWSCVLISRCKIFCNSRKKKHYMVINIINTTLNHFEEYCFVILSLPVNVQKHSKSVVFQFSNAGKDYIFLLFLFPKFVKGKLSFPSLLNWNGEWRNSFFSFFFTAFAKITFPYFYKIKSNCFQVTGNVTTFDCDTKVNLY